jgi:hypothetical protein
MPRVAESAPTEQSVLERLSAPFDPRDLSVKPQAVTKDRQRALAVWYLDARAVMDRLDLVMGVDGWCDRYEHWDEVVCCRLSLKIGGAWITKCDVGGCGDGGQNADAVLDRKGAFSDALKRAAVRFGVGRYLYQIPGQWCDWDDQRREFKSTPRLPDWALPEGTGQQREREPGEDDDGIKPATMKRLQALIASLQKSDNAVRVSLRARYQVETLDALTEQQAQELIRELDRINRAMNGEQQSDGAGSRRSVGRKGGAR